MGTVAAGQGGGGAVDLQTAYNASGAPPHIVVDGSNLGLTIRDNATPIGSALFQVQNNAGSQTYFNVAAAQVQSTVPFDVTISSVRVARAQAGQFDVGRSGRRLVSMQDSDGTGYPSIEYLPDGATRTTATGGSMLRWSSTVTTNVPGGAPFGNDNAPSAINWQGTTIFADPGNLFATQLLINAAAELRLQANAGPVYVFLDQYKHVADGGSYSFSQHNSFRIQPSWGPNLSGGSITQTSAELIYLFCTVDATVGSASVTTMNYIAAKTPTLTAGGTIGTFTVLDIAAITGPTTIRGINSAMSSGTFIRHVGTAVSTFAGEIQMNNAVPVRYGASGGASVNLLRSAAGTLRMIGTGGTNNEGLDLSFDANPNNVYITSPTSAGFNFDVIEMAIGPTGGALADGTNNWFLAFSPGLRGTQLAGDYSEVLFTSASSISVAHAITNFATWTVNAPSISIGGGSITNAANVLIQTNMAQGTNRYGLLITSNPSGGTLNYAMRVTAGDSRFDGRVDINNPIALGGGAAATLGTIGGSGPTAAAQAQWLEVDIGGTPHWIPVWT